MKQQEKWMEYSALISEKIIELLQEEIREDVLEEGDNLTDLFYALSVVSPAMLYSHITGNEVNNLEFNHLANRLCFQYSNLSKETEE